METCNVEEPMFFKFTLCKFELCFYQSDTAEVSTKRSKAI